MVRAAKTSVDKAPVAPVSDKPKAVKKVKAPKESAPVVDASTVVVVAVDAESDPSLQFTSKLSDFGEKINQLTSLLSAMKNEYKTLEKTISRELKAAQKASQKKKRASGNRAPSGFVKPTLISDELAAFLGKEK